jgi:hypothetical protein
MARVHVSARLDEGLLLRVRERSVMEGRSFTNMVERLLGLGLGTVVTERDGSAGVASDAGTPVGRLHGTADQAPAPSRSVTAVCPNARMHRPGVYCKSCGETV